MGTPPWLHVFREVYLLRKKSSTAPTKRLTKRSKNGQFTGNQKELNESSGYTRSFGVCMALCCKGLSAQSIVLELQKRGL